MFLRKIAVGTVAGAMLAAVPVVAKPIPGKPAPPASGKPAPPAPGGGPLSLVSEIKIEKRVPAADGTTRMVLVKADKIVPGDRVVFVLTYRNTGTQPLGNLVLANPVPRNIAYRSGNPGSAAPEVSVDGKTFGTLSGLRVAAATGGARAALPDDVTTVRWRLASPLAAGAQGQLAFQAVLK